MWRLQGKNEEVKNICFGVSYFVFRKCQNHDIYLFFDHFLFSILLAIISKIRCIISQYCDDGKM